MVIGGEILVLFAMWLGLGDPAPYGACAVVIAGGVLANAATAWRWPKQHVLEDFQAITQLSMDILQISALLALVGGAANPFALVLIAPVTLAAATLPLRPVLFLGGLASVASMGLAVFALDYPSVLPEPRLTDNYRLASGLANVAGIASPFIGCQTP